MKNKEVKEESFVVVSENDNLTQAKMREMRRGSYQGVFKYDNNTHSVVHPSSISLSTENTMIDVRGNILKITKILESRPHKGVYVNEKNREKITIVNAIPVVFTLK